MKTLNGKILLGWMGKKEALAYLCEEAVPPLSEEAAIELWESYRKKCGRLGKPGISQTRECAA
jgi:DNA-binding IclR family transcriptional regulator